MAKGSKNRKLKARKILTLHCGRNLLYEYNTQRFKISIQSLIHVVVFFLVKFQH